jgi:hypothetical protein
LTIELANFVAEGRANISFTFAKSSWPFGSVDYCCRVVKSELTVDLKMTELLVVVHGEVYRKCGFMCICLRQLQE